MQSVPRPPGSADGTRASFADLLREYRFAKALSQRELAERSGLTTKAVSALERGERRRPYPHTVRALADALDLSTQDRLRLTVAVPRGPAGGHRERQEPPDGPPADRSVGGRLPSPTGPILGRELELARLHGSLNGGTSRLITLTGPGGVGKTTLAHVAVAGAVDRFAGRAIWVDLSEEADPARVLPAIATALGVPETGWDGSTAGLASAVSGRRVLVLLDNLEHLVRCAPALAELVARCPELTVIATSRVALRVRPEQEIRVGPLAPHDALELFHRRAVQTGAATNTDVWSPTAVAELCARADGLPLAVELAVSAAKVLGPEALLGRLAAHGHITSFGLRDLPRRQRSMAETLEWSLELLDEPARTLLGRLSVLRGGFSFDAVEAVAETDPHEALSSLAQLLEHSLVMRLPAVAGVERLRLLEPVREYLAKGLDPASLAAARTGLVDWMTDATEALEGDLLGRDPLPALELLEAGIGNVRTTFRLLVESDDLERAGDFLHALRMFLLVRGRAGEGAHWARQLYARVLSTRCRVVVVSVWATLELARGNLARSDELSREGLALAEAAGHVVHATWNAVNLVFVSFATGDLAAARELLWTAERHGASSPEDEWLRVHLPVARGLLAAADGDPVAAARWLREAEVFARRQGHPLQVVVTLRSLGQLSADEGRLQDGVDQLAESVEIARVLGDSAALSYSLPVLGDVALRLGELAQGVALLGAAASCFAARDVGTDQEPVGVTVESSPATAPYAEAVGRAREQLGAAEAEGAWQRGRAASPGEVIALVRRLRTTCGSGSAPGSPDG